MMLFTMMQGLEYAAYKTCEVTPIAAHQGFFRVVGLLSRRLPLPGAAVVQPFAEVGRGVGVEGVLQQVGPVLHAPPMPPPLPRPVQAHGVAPALNLHSGCSSLRD